MILCPVMSGIYLTDVRDSALTAVTFLIKTTFELQCTFLMSMFHSYNKKYSMRDIWRPFDVFLRFNYCSICPHFTRFS